MRVLVTRPQPDANRLADRLQQAGHKAVISPLLRIEFTEDPLPPLDSFQALLITSGNGARALARNTGRRDMRLLCVGDASARQAREDGFDDVESAGGDTVALAELTRASCDPADGPLLHVTGSAVAGALAENLREDGYSVESQMLYRANIAAQLPETAREALSDGSLDAVMLFSPRTARTFATLLKKAEMETTCTGLHLLCLSEAVANELRNIPSSSVRIAARPTTDALFDVLD